ncbi:unnamed protein product [Brachionus calyciflorus]|uniref:Insulin-like growth factor-binding complex acid labile subunit n=1 Tax=Brachionus calyciflorus TaxID=104777 RepID=A0A814KPM9_9BILA|nr:unnamed protein product [Brachionus calyciflorus]
MWFIIGREGDPVNINKSFKEFAIERFTRIKPDENSLFNDKTVVIQEFPKQSRLMCIKKCIFYDSTCQFFQFTNTSKCTIYSSFKRENLNDIKDVFMRKKKLPRIYFLNGSFLERTQLDNLFNVSNLSLNKISLIGPFAFVNSNKTTILDLSYNNLTIIYSKSFYGMFNLKTLNLTANQISLLESDAFKDLSKLAFLDLGNNSLRYLDENIFDNLQELKNINLEFNQIELIEKYTFKNLIKLENIFLNNNYLKFLGLFFHNLTSFLYLDVSFNQIRFVHNDTFRSLKNLKTILISYNQITEINSETFKGATNLKKLDMKLNKIERIDTQFIINFPLLEDLDLSQSNLSFIESDFFKGFVNLKNLILYKSNINRIDLNSLKNLKFLYLSDNKINFFSQNLSSLVSLHLTFNPLGNLTYPLINVPNSILETLSISHCKLTNIDFDILRNFTKLKTLGIAGTLMKLKNDTFDGFKSLKTVFINLNETERFKFLYPNINFQ